ncbi:MAG: PAS domain S-box protein, partial [SAR324 cluster bacterium]|nr:PAS domain S-box protein [SAR324 cluster bacterium]
MVEKTSAHHDQAAASPAPPRESFRELANRFSHGTIILRNGRIVFANDPVARMLGYKDGRELEGESHEKVVAPRDRRRMTRNLERRLRGEPMGSQIEFQAIRKDGSPVWFESIATVVEWQGEPAVQATVRQAAQPRRFEEKLRKSEAKYQRLVESSAQGVVVFGETVLFANRAAARILGYPRAEILVGKKPYRFVAPHDRHRLKEMEEAAIRGENVRNRFEFEGLRADGSLVWIESVATIVNWEGKRSFQMTLLDVTERKRAETELKEKTLLLEQILENLPIGLNVVDKNLKLLHHNPRYRELMGFPEREVRKWKTYEDAIRFNAQRGEYGTGDVKKIVAERVKQAKRPQPRHYERMRPNGSWIEIRGNPLPGGGFITTFSDITPRKKAEEALRLSEERHRDLVEGSLQGVLIHRDSKPLFVNQAFAEIFGYESPEEILALGTNLKLLAPRERKRVRDYHRRRLRGEDVPARYEVQGLRKDGSMIWIEVLNRVVNWDGRLAVQGTINDITERKRAEQDLRENERLLQTVFDAIPHSIFVKDRKSRYLMVNRATGRQYNIDPAEFRNSPTADHTFADAATIKNFLKTDRRVIRTGQPVDLPEEQLILRNGEKRYHHLI